MYDAEHPPSSMRTVILIIFAVIAVNVIKPQVALCQNASSQRNECAISEILKPTKTVTGTYTEEATKKNVEGTVILCVTVDGRGRVTDVRPLSGPAELVQSSINAARQSQFEAPQKAPASTTMEMSYSLTKPCPEGKGSDAGDIVTTIVPTEEKVGDLKIIGKLYQPWPPYPEVARAERRRGQLYLDIVVNPDGSVSDVRITKSLDELLDKLAVETVRTWRFKVSPEGKATSFSVTLSFRIPCLDHR
jgi:TonB family protein